MRELNSMIHDIEKYLLSNVKSFKYFNSSNNSDLFIGEAGEFIKTTYLNSSDDREEYFEKLNNTLWNVTQVMEEMGYEEMIDMKLW